MREDGAGDDGTNRKKAMGRESRSDYGRRAPFGPATGWSTPDQALLSLVDEYVGDNRCSRRPFPTARRLIPGFQFSNFFPACGSCEHGL